MTKREAKAVKMVKEHFPSLGEDNRNTDDVILEAPLTQLVLEAMQWQAEQCMFALDAANVEETTFDDSRVVLHAGTEEV